MELRDIWLEMLFNSQAPQELNSKSYSYFGHKKYSI